MKGGSDQAMFRSIKGKFYFLYFSSASLFLFLTGTFIIYSVLEYNNIKFLVREIKEFNETSSLIHLIQKERGLTVKYLTVPSADNKYFLDSWKNQTSDFITNSKYSLLFQNIPQKLNSIRNSTHIQNNARECFFEYTTIIHNLLDSLYTGSFFAKLPQQDIFYRMFRFAMTREYFGALRAYVFVLLTKQEVSRFDRFYIAEKYNLFLINGGGNLKDLQENFLIDESKESIKKTLQEVDFVINSIINDNNINITNEEWFNLCSIILDEFFKSNINAQNLFETKLNNQKKNITIYLLVITTISPIFIIITLRIVYKFINSFSKRVSTIDRKMKLILGTNNYSIEFNDQGNDEISNISASLNNLLRFTNKLICEKDKIAAHDRLTGLFNRGKFIELFSSELNRFTRYNTPFCVMLLDIDFFKKINDTYGHNIGDEVLVAIGNLVSGAIRKVDVFARWGGEEFVLLTPSSTLAVSTELAEKLRELVEAFVFPHNIRLTMSFGITGVLPEDTLEKIIARADAALYQSKHDGRNRVTVVTSTAD